ncbi:putative transposase, Ptta/En/Spm, plant [Sesbania bispinosa]|nr:putative transposase, Ptta/En/Spm, plant [Sesbania bispinosa]
MCYAKVGTSKKRTRGPTRCLKIHARSIEERQEVTLDEGGEPIGPNDKVVSDLSYFLGTVARNGNFCPLIYTSFKALTKEERERIWGYVNEKFIIPEIGKKAVFARINDAWRRYKNFIKNKYFLNYPSLKERLKNRPKSIPHNHFRALMTYWTNSVVQDVSKKNAVNRAKQKYIHRMGPTNFARIRAKLRAKKENGEDVSQAEMFVETRQSRKGKEVDQETQNAITKIQDSINTSSETADEAFQSLFGKEKPGRVRYMGRTITPTMLKKNEEIAALKKQHSEEISSMSKQLKGMEALLRCFMKQNNPDLDDEALDNMMGNAITPRSSASSYIPNHNEVKLLVTYLSLVH